MKVQSPCIKVCKLQDSYCVGCFRHIDEIKNWKKLTDDEKLTILKRVVQKQEQDSSIGLEML